jgi:hypothetical protein
MEPSRLPDPAARWDALAERANQQLLHSEALLRSSRAFLAEARAALDQARRLRSTLGKERAT